MKFNLVSGMKVVEGITFNAHKALNDSMPRWISEDGRIVLQQLFGKQSYRVAVNGTHLPQHFRSEHTAVKSALAQLGKVTK